MGSAEVSWMGDASGIRGGSNSAKLLPLSQVLWMVMSVITIATIYSVSLIWVCQTFFEYHLD